MPIVVAAAAAELLLCEGAPRVRAGAGRALCRQCQNPRGRAGGPRAVCRIASLDLIVLHSVAQYLTPAETGRLFALFRRLLKSDGTLVVSDVIPPQVPAATDAVALLRFGAAHGFLVAAVHGLGRAFVSDYWRLRSRLGLTRYGEAGHDRKARRRRICGAPRGKEHRTQSGAHDVHRTAHRHRLTGLPSPAILV